ncbi:MAG: ATP synthase F0 subunit B [Deltaproteobacteria bacterium]|jgi:F-type H+-transporting ATPase subunit b|nr:ATP synthase F0 subunit B [Deltaproteobacteria bacterium]
MVDISLNFSLILQIINFLVLTVLLNYLVYKPLRKIISEREALFDSLKHEADTAKLMIEEGESTSAKQRDEVLVEGTGIIKRYTLEGRDKEQAIIAESHHETTLRITEARASLAAAVNEARRDLKSEAESLSRTLVEKILGRSLAS